MLVLSRRVGEEIIIDNNIRVTIVAVKGERVRVGVVAPRHVSVDREEIHAIKENQEEHVLVPIVTEAVHDCEIPLGVLPARSHDDTLPH